MTTTISQGAIAPIGSDLTAEDLRMQIIRGWETMIRHDVALATGVSVKTGEWCKLNAAGEVAALTSTPVAHSYLCIAGSDRFDSKGTGKVTLCMSREGVQVKTSLYDTGASYAVGDYLTPELVSSEGKMTKQTSTEPKMGRVLKVGTGFIEYEMLPGF